MIKCIQTPALSSTHRPAVAQLRLAGTPLGAASILLTRFHHQWTAPRYIEANLIMKKTSSAKRNLAEYLMHKTDTMDFFFKQSYFL